MSITLDDEGVTWDFGARDDLDCTLWASALEVSRGKGKKDLREGARAEESISESIACDSASVLVLHLN